MTSMRGLTPRGEEVRACHQEAVGYFREMRFTLQPTETNWDFELIVPKGSRHVSFTCSAPHLAPAVKVVRLKRMGGDHDTLIGGASALSMRQPVDGGQSYRLGLHNPAAVTVNVDPVFT